METVTFDQLTRGEQYKVLLGREYQDLIRLATLDIAMIKSSLDKYAYSASERMEVEEELRLRVIDLDYYRKSLRTLSKGAENEDIILTVLSPSTETPQYKEESCTTVN